MVTEAHAKAEAKAEACVGSVRKLAKRPTWILLVTVAVHVAAVHYVLDR